MAAASSSSSSSGGGGGGREGPMDETRKPARLRTRVTVRNHLNGPGGGDEPPIAARELMSESKEGLLGFASGLVAGVVGVCVGYPWDVMKTRRQVYGSQARLLEHGWRQPPAQILRQLFRGIGPPLLTTGFVQTINFGVYDNVLRTLRLERAAELQAAGAGPEAVARALRPENARLRDYFVAGMCGGVSISFITCPASLVKIQMQTTSAGSNISYWTIVAGMRSRGLVNGFYRAYIPDLINQSLGRGVYMCGYECMKRVVREAFPPQEPPAATDTYTRRPQPLYQRIIAASVAGIAGWIVIYPLDVVRTKLQADALAPGKNKYSGMADCLRQTLAQGGPRAFFNGLGFTLLRSAPVASAVLPMYDYTFYTLAVLLGIEPPSPE